MIAIKKVSRVLATRTLSAKDLATRTLKTKIMVDRALPILKKRNKNQ